MNVPSSLLATAATVSYLDDLKIPRDKKDLAQKCANRDCAATSTSPIGSAAIEWAAAARAAGFKPGPQAPSREGDTGG